MNVDKFAGIAAYHDGSVISDYCNVIPLDNSIIDRQGELLCPIVDEDGNPVDLPNTFVAKTSFVDSHQNIYIVTENDIKRFTLRNKSQADTTLVMRELRLNGQQPNLDINLAGPFSFCESSTKPSQVYFCDGYNVFYWNTTDHFDTYEIPENVRDRVKPFVMTMIPMKSGIADAATRIIGINGTTAENATEQPYGWWDNALVSDFGIKSIAWFDNRLVCCQQDKNTVWLSVADPSRYLVPADGKSAPFAMYSYTASPDNMYVPYYSFIPNYYSSTASSANLQEVVAFAGQLYFLNDSSIEIWSATNNDGNPIQLNAQNILYFGGRSPVIIADTMYLICHDAIHNDFIAAITRSGQVQTISNDEIERQLAPGAVVIKPLSIRDQSMIVVYTSDTYLVGYSATKLGKWWRAANGKFGNEFQAWTLGNFNGRIIGVSNYGRPLISTDANRLFADGRAITRFVRGGFTTFIGRKIMRVVNIIGDTGVYAGSGTERPQLYIRLSFDRGLSFGPYLYRTVGRPGANDREMQWRNCGSGNSVLLEFGTSGNIRFQIYGLNFELA